jgi:hypothetical protein
MMQAEADLDRFPRRQRGGREAAVAAVDLLAELQRNALGITSTLPDQALAAAAEELDGLADNAEPELARICRTVALRLKVEIAKRGGQQDASA